jgi:hypothetical protein
MDPLPDGAHAVGAALRSATPTSASRPPRIHSQRKSQGSTGSAAETVAGVPHHPHIQHANLGTTSIYLQGIDPEEIIATVHMRRAPMMSATAVLRL